VPIQLRGQVVGSVEWELPLAGFGEEQVELARELASRLAYSLDNARLFQESQRAAERERLVNSIAAKLTAQTSIDAILQTAVREVGQALRAPQVSIRLGAEPNGSASGNGHHN
jgi:GAF domain-containing protein